MQSPIAQMQRATYPRYPNPAGLAPVRAIAQHRGIPPGRGRSAAPQGLGFLGAGAVLTQGITGVKTGVTATGVATTIGGGVASAIGAGAAAGSVVPIIGTAIGVIVGLVASGVFNHRVDPEVGNFNAAIQMAQAQGPQAVLGIQDKYLVLAGLFDLLPGQIKGNIPIYKKYGRMGEYKFVSDMCALIQQAANQGIITANDTVQSVYDKVVAPWINSWGYGPMQDTNASLINYIILGLIGEYVSGQFKQRWYARGGDFAFNALPLFTLPGATATAPTNSGTPVQGPTNAPAQPVSQIPITTYTPTPQGSVAIPQGFVLVGQANNLPAYQGPDGAFYSWNGTTMTPLTGVLLGAGGQSLQVQSGYPVQTAATQSPPAGGTPFQMAQPSQLQTGGGDYSSYAPAPAASAPAAATAGVSGAGLPAWMTWGAVAGVVVLMFATARPVGGPAKMRRRSR
jgi:hypothetical protein